MTKPAMIPRTGSIWQHELRDAICSIQALFELLELDGALAPETLIVHKDFPLRVPRAFADRIKKGDWGDPLLLQVLPLAKELDYTPGFSADPLEEEQAIAAPGLIHKYHGRVLLIATGSCAIHCRYCFRRHFPYQENKPSAVQWRQALDYIRQDKSIKEVILSGGDPLLAPDRYLAELVDQLSAISHLERLRIHTRLPIVIPQRITTECLDWLTAGRLQPVLVLHCNHANEIDDAVAESIKQLHKRGVTVLNQSVLLRQVNDQADTLVELSEALFKVGVLPYYLHLLDRVAGAAHFDISEVEALALIDQLRSRLPGYMVPKLVKELPGKNSKTPI